MNSRAGILIRESAVGAIIIVFVAPIVWMGVLAVQPVRNIISAKWVFGFSLTNVTSLFASGESFGTQIMNSIVIVVGTVAITLVVGALAGYSLSRLEWPRRYSYAILALAGLIPIIPPMTLVPGLYSLLDTMGLLGSIAGLVVLNTVFNLPFATLLMKVYFDSVPGDLREAALMDGASESLTFLRVMLPIARPGLASVAIYTAIMSWNEFLFGLTMTSGGTTSPFTVGIASLVQPYEVAWGQMAAAGAVTALPIVLISVIAGKWLISGITQGAVKG